MNKEKNSKAQEHLDAGKEYLGAGPVLAGKIWSPVKEIEEAAARAVETAIPMRSLLKYCHHKLFPNSKRWYPLLSLFYLTNECDFFCSYCSDGHNRPYYQLSNEVLDFPRTQELARQIRKYTDYLVITGGEPSLHPHFAEVMRYIGTLGFKNVAINTNGYYIDRYFDDIADVVDTLIFSLDTMDEGKADSILGRGPGFFTTILSNIEKAAAYTKKNNKFDIAVSSVATPGTITDLYGVYRFCRDQGFTFAVCPQMEGKYAHSDLRGNPEYRAFLDFLIEEKKKGGNIYGTKLYLEYMRDIRKFNCYPFLLLTVSPTGAVFFPCLEKGNYHGSLLTDRSLHAIKEGGLEKYGPLPECGNCCQTACSLSFFLLMEHLFSYVV
ncbi:MAG: radical SAM protein [bacterium]|nr:radical SAM protein [bacterium]